LLSQWKLHAQAGQAWLYLRDYSLAIEELIQAGEFKLAEENLKHIKEENKLAAFQVLAEGFYKKGSDFWPSAYHYYYLAMNTERVQYIENRCRLEKVEKYITLALCYQKVGLADKISLLANELELPEDHRDAELAARCWQIAGDGEQAAKNWMQVFYRESDRWQTLLGPNPREKQISSSSLRRFYNHMTEQRNSYGIDLQEWEKLDYYAGSDQDQFRKIARIVSRASLSDAWKKECDKERAHLVDVFQRSGMEFPSGDGKLKFTGKPGLSDYQVHACWDELDAVLSQFWNRAITIAEDEFDAHPLQSVHIMARICNRPHEAERLVERLGKQHSREHREIYIQSWQYLNWPDARISQELSRLYPLNDAEIIWQAIHMYFPENSHAYTDALEKFKKRLEGMKSAEARKLLKNYFPDYEFDVDASRGKKPETGSAQPLPQIEALAAELVERSKTWEMDSDDRDELVERARELLQPQAKNSRPLSKLKALRALAPAENLSESDRDLFDQLEQAIKLIAISGEMHSPVQTLETPRVSVDGPDPRTVITPPRSEELYPINHRDQSNYGQQISRRKARKANDEPGKVFRVDLHEYNQKDADIEIESAIIKVIEDKQYRALLVIHGYGKDKEPSILKENARERLRQFKSHGRVRKFLVGERIEKYSDNWSLALKLAPDLDENEIVQNPGITLVLLRDR
jgi:DNA-nicking Smr family endonuclease